MTPNKIKEFLDDGFCMSLLALKNKGSRTWKAVLLGPLAKDKRDD